MKKQIISLISILVIGTSVFAQSSDIYTFDEIVRIKLSVPLVTYDTIGGWDNAAGEAYYTLVINSFNENLIIPEFTLSNITINDKIKVEEIIKRLNELKQNPPTWDDLLDKQTQYLIWLDKALRRSSKYKTAIKL
jgi:hypothetical protein